MPQGTTSDDVCACFHGKEQAGETRKRVYDVLRATAVEQGVCAECMAIAALYLAAKLGIEHLTGTTKETFLETAAAVWDDTAQQHKAQTEMH